MSLLPFPSPPTDNLYKFVAIAGLVLLIGAPVYWATFVLAVGEREVEYELAVIKSIQIPGEVLIPPRGDSAEATHARAEARKRLDAEELSHHRAKARLDLYEAFRAWVTGLSILAAALGIVLSVVGFRLWFTRVQRQQDKLLKHQAADPEKSPAV